MCWTCDHPEASEQDYLDYMQARIDEFGWAVQHVEQDLIHPPFSYTIGLTVHGLPELVVTGMPADQAAHVLNILARDQAGHGGPYRPGSTHRINVPGLRVRGEMVAVTAPWAHLFTAVEFYGEGIGALQFVYTDRDGRWPWQPSYRGAHPGGQPVLGVRCAD